MSGKLVAAAAAAVLVAGPHAAGAACSAEAFKVDRTELTVSVCTVEHRAAAHAKVAAPAAGVLQETLAVKNHAPIIRTVDYSRLTSEETARTIDDVPLQPLGITKTLHLTLAIRGGAARVEHALLIPGAVVLK
ncbi:MAG: hypothetical protein M3R44_04560 [Candidatus Eremiobacteraeota bacterium]|nr:hypothetical protein [Candidatus Eremiobacteraeota bacterium]